ncbi:hypothetical protein BT96DRAFT_1008738 [Gymnopus androsaceus JB14]|uniref:Carrier domain-containing protein n=1 Tax=Gymnopus androsaceus JB14 TaxID=1447944 RepID=A0A6A4GE88_9AGAR|nr:hypothetical protein BT96DRAFT_1008738 [Gymnopus androsaceus JB14]
MLIGINVLVLSGTVPTNIFARYTDSPSSKSSRTTRRTRLSISVVSKGKPSANVTWRCLTILRIRMGTSKPPLFIDIRTPKYTFSHPNGLLFATQFAQIALVVTEKAAFEDMRAKGFVQTDCAFAGHSLGEYSALASIANVLAISALVDIVFYCEITMQHAVERDSENRSNYAMCAVNPSRISKSFSDAALWEVVESISQLTGTLLEIVNYNVEGQQYVCAGEVVALQTMANILNYLKVKKIDITKLTETFSIEKVKEILGDIVQECHGHSNRHLAKKIDPMHLNPDVLIGNYIPNLIAKPFDVLREYAQIIYNQTSSPRLGKVLRKWDEDKWESAAKRQQLAYIILDLLFAQFHFEWLIELGPSPTLTGMATRTLKAKYEMQEDCVSLTWEILCHAKHSKEIYYLFEDDASAASEPEVEAPAAASAPVASTPAPVTIAAPVGASGPAASIEDFPIKSSDILIAIVSQKLKKPVSEISMSKSIKDLVGGKSTLQNEILGNLQQEFSSAREKGEELPLEELGPALGSGHSGALGKYTTGLNSRLIGGTSFEIVGLGPLQADGVLLLGTTMEPAKRLGSEAEAKAWLDGVTTAYAQRSGISWADPGAAGGGGGGGGGAEQECFTMRYLKRDSRSGEIAFDAEKANSAALQAKLDSIAKEHGNL